MKDEKRDVRHEKLKTIRDRVVNLKDSTLYSFRNENEYLPVIGQGDHYAEIMFIGEAPGESEAKSGVPFCGRAGKVLDELLQSINIPREEVYITNIVKDRPPQNRDPSPEEIALYAPFLDEQIEIIEPKVIATLGRFSMEYILKRYGLEDKIEPISKIHGQLVKANFKYGDVFITPLYHPAVALYNAGQKETLIEDFKNIKKALS
ncbi:MAG: uracil-DNA glycosylase [Candidatus Campbellbacteria bacterium]|nr:uracil-DNA glycosylase [Candidatus Campbellbacteria bacterium]